MCPRNRARYRGTVNVSTSGTVTGGTFTGDDGVSGTVTGGSLSITNEGVITGTVNFSDGTINTISHAKMDNNKTMGAYVGIDNGNFRFAGTFIKSGGTFSTSDLAGAWHFHLFLDRPTVNDPGWVKGTITFNTSGVVIGGSVFTEDGFSGTITGGSLSIDSTGLISGSITVSVSSVTNTVTISNGKADISKTVVALVGIDSQGFRLIGTVIKNGGAFSTGDLAGTWFFYTFSDHPTMNDPGWDRRMLTVNASGQVTGGSFVGDDGVSGTGSGGSLSIDANGVITGSVNFSDGTVNTISQAKMDSSKTQGAYVGIDNGGFRFLGGFMKAEEPAISVTPSSQDFGSVTVGSIANSTFTVQNTGGGTFSGSASTSAPFSIVSGGSYSLGGGASQTVTVHFSPTSAGTFLANVTFSGGGGATRTVTGTGVSVVTTLGAEASTYTLTVTKAGTGSGTVTSSPAGINCGTDCTETYNSGTSVALTATPASGSSASLSPVSCSGNACSVTATFNVSVGGGSSTLGLAGFGGTVTGGTVTGPIQQLVFSVITLAVNTAPSLIVSGPFVSGAGGTVISNPAGIDCGAGCSGLFSSGTTVTLTAVPATGFVFAGWRGDCTGTGTCTVTVNANSTVSAVFSLPFTDDPLSVQVTPIKAVHITQLRQAINNLRSQRGVGAFNFTDPTFTPGVTQVRAVHITDLRTALNGVYDALVRARPTYTDPTITAGLTAIKRAHISEIRSAIRAAE